MKVEDRRKCNSCKYAIEVDYGYSNYTVEGTTVDCLLHLNPKFPEDRFYGLEPYLLFANECKSFSKGDPVGIDCDQEDGSLENYSNDPEIKNLLKEYNIHL